MIKTAKTVRIISEEYYSYLEKEVNNLLGRLSASNSTVSIDDIKLSSSGEEYIAMIIYTEQREVWY